MSEKRFSDIWCSETGHIGVIDFGIDKECTSDEFEDFLNELNEEKEYWKKQAMTLLMQVRRLTSRMTDKEVKEFSKELEECVSE